MHNLLMFVPMEIFLPALIVSLILTPLVAAQSDSPVYNVLDYGAAGDGQKDDTDAFVKAWEATCKSSSSSSTMHVPSGKTFLIQPVTMEGPCNSRVVNVEINGNIIAPDKPSEWSCYDNCHTWIDFSHVDGLSINGDGTIDGRGNRWWNSHEHKKPTALKISNAKNVRLSGLSFKDNPRMHVVLDGLQSIYVSDITINAPEDSPNTDGIHVSGCTDVVIHRCQIGTGDDCISIVDGSSNLKIDNIICGPGHGISIGSLGKHGANDKVENVQVTDVVFNRTTNGARIKTWQGGSGYARNILFERILSIEADNPIIIDQFYCDHEHCVTHKSAVQVSDVTFRQVVGTSRRKTAVKLDCSESVPCKNIFMDDIYILSKDEEDVISHCKSAHGRVTGLNVPSVSCLDHGTN